MVYLGGKHYSAKYIADVLANYYEPGTRYYEPFFGSGYVLTKLADRLSGPIIISDLNRDLVEMWKAVRDGFQPPKTLSKQEWQRLKVSHSSPLRTAAGFGLSFSGIWFSGYAGMDRPAKSIYPCQALKRSFELRRPILKRCVIKNCAYGQLSPRDGDTVYCDPPYAGTEQYSAVGDFNSKEFWKWARKQSDKGVRIFVSEYAAPKGWKSVWEKKIASNIKTVASKSKRSLRATEKLFTIL